MERVIEADLDADAADVHAALSDLSTYSQWLDIVHEVQPAPSSAGDSGPAWWVTLRAQVGPFARSKRLRMVRTQHHPNSHITFKRAEVDGRKHSAWTLEVATAGDQPCHVKVNLRYEGRLWTAPLEVILGSEAKDAVPRLQALVTDQAA